METWPDRVVRALRCPVCGQDLTQAETGLTCVDGHRFDAARQGYVTLRAGHGHSLNADTVDMVMARERLQSGGWYLPVADAVASAVAQVASVEGAGTGLLLDLAGGTGYYAAAALDALPGWRGIVMDLSTPAVKRAARTHERAVAVGGDALKVLPVVDGAVDIVLSVFGPRVPAEIARIVRPTGALVVVTPLPQHLSELVAAVDGVQVHEGKSERLAAQFPGWERVLSRDVVTPLALTADAARDVLAMGPNAHHVAAETLDALGAREATLAVRVEALRAPGGGAHD
ncbi:putative RNA methyltransferase [Demequina sp. NBRC 110051]|uniref:putative RNA methyltransferase n=1 Tax=Demequina sp. NBRC 110051 TaxID=1570340 RepID=UPI0009FD8F03|nr:methyltransferase domain-containing protein [Demequina sp. NBRC 110051]